MKLKESESKRNTKGTATPLILDIKGNSLDDGPGIRSVVFFKGCPLNCLWCHNPESKRRGVEISHDPALCLGCGACAGTCRFGAVSPKNPFFVDRNICTLCFECLGTCPSGALTRVGREMTVEQIVATIERDKPFFDNSGGGVTLSGGEPTLFPEFLAKLLRVLRKKGIRVLLETCGLFDGDYFLKEIYPLLDAVYFDLKLIDDTAHRKYCGASNALILENFRRLAREEKKGGISVLPRTPLVPGITDSRENLTGLAAFLKGEGVRRAALLAYNPLWYDKQRKIGLAENPETNKAMRGFQKPEAVKGCEAVYHAAGIETV